LVCISDNNENDAPQLTAFAATNTSFRRLMVFVVSRSIRIESLFLRPFTLNDRRPLASLDVDDNAAFLVAPTDFFVFPSFVAPCTIVICWGISHRCYVVILTVVNVSARRAMSCVSIYRYLTCWLFLLLTLLPVVDGWQVVLVGGTGPIGQRVATLLPHHDVIILTRNAFLAGAPSRVSHDFGWVGTKFLQTYPHITLRDWDGGDLLDIVGKDWLGWQEDTLLPRKSNESRVIVIHLTGGYTEQRVMACERLVRESLRVNPSAMHITVSPTIEDLARISPGVTSLKESRLQRCEQLVSSNCLTYQCLRLPQIELNQLCQRIVDAFEERLAMNKETVA
jgi:hypothetical protein